MAKTNLEIKFPCGLEIKQEIESVMLTEAQTWDDVKECPLHGKTCMKIGKKIEVKKKK